MKYKRAFTKGFTKLLDGCFESVDIVNIEVHKKGLVVICINFESRNGKTK